MSAQPIEKSPTDGLEPDEGPQDGLGGPTPERGGAPEQIEVRHQAAVSLLLAVATSAIAIAYLWRAASTGAAFDWILCATLALLTVGLFRNLLDARLPLLVADELGVRFRLGRQWRGLPWEAVDRIVVSPRRGVLRDGRLIVSLHHMHRAIEGIEGRARRHARMNQKMYGAVLAVPLGLTTRISNATEETLQERFAELAHGRADVVTLLPEPDPVPAARNADHDSAVPAETVEPTAFTAYSAPEAPVLPEADPYADPDTEPYADTDVHTDAYTDAYDADDAYTDTHTEPEARSAFDDDEQAPAQERRPRWLRRSHARETPADESFESVEVVEESTARDGSSNDEAGGEALVGAEREGVRPLGPDAAALPTQSTPLTAPLAHASSKVRAIARLGEPVAPLVIEDFEPHPAYDPVIGPDLAAARTRVGLSVDELADRTRIRPHVIESIEVDDFTPCGGDFYARGHIRTLARVLGKDPVPMLASFDSRYATAPISPRRVFEAELATGLTGSMRSTRGGPNWALMIGAVLMLVLIWSAVRLFSVDPETAFETPPPVLNGSSGISNGFGEPAAPATAPAVETTLSAVEAGAGVEVRDGEDALVFEGDLVIGEVKRLSVAPPVTVTTDNGGAVSATVGGRDMGFLGEAGEPATRVFQSPSR